MPLGRIVSSGAAAVGVAACAAVALAMSGATADHNTAGPSSVPSTTVTTTHHRSTAPAPVPPPSTSRAPTPAAPTNTSTSRQPARRTTAVTLPTRHAARVPAEHSAPATTSASTQHRTHSAPATPKPEPKPKAKRGRSLPLGYSTGSASKVITVVAQGTGSTVATLQAWAKAAGGGWLRHGSAVTAHIGSQGMTPHPSESRSATPMGSFTLTQAFGRNRDPGTSLPYFRTTPADWWISQSGPLYNTHQRCSSGCSFTQGSPNEHLYYETPYYNYAVVINTPSGASAYPHGSAFFLHVTDGAATAGCVAIPQSRLVSLMRWLNPGAHPRILIGTD